MSGHTSLEADALHAVIEGNDEEAARILDGLLTGELRSLRSDAQALSRLCTDILGARAIGEKAEPKI